MTASSAATSTAPTRKQIKRWQRYLANERAEAAVYRELALKKQGEEREILLGIAEAEARHEEHWRTLLGDHVGMPRRPDYSTLLMGFLAKRFGSVFTLALMQSAEARTPYEKDDDATDQMTADERIHAEVVRGLAAKSREKMSGNFRAAVFGANDGLVSNLAPAFPGCSPGHCPWVLANMCPCAPKGNFSKPPRPAPTPTGRCPSWTSTPTNSPWCTAPAAWTPTPPRRMRRRCCLVCGGRVLVRAWGVFQVVRRWGRPPTQTLKLWEVAGQQRCPVSSSSPPGR